MQLKPPAAAFSYLYFSTLFRSYTRIFPSANILVNINEIHELTLTNGTKIFENGEILVYDLKSIEKYRYEKAAARGSSCLITSALILGLGFYFLEHFFLIYDW